jgi:hypothetical protein
VIKTPVDPLILAGGFLVGLAYMMFVAPAWCGATTRSGEPCRKNAQGVLLGCSYRQHKWQKVQHFPQLVKSVTLGASNLVGSALVPQSPPLRHWLRR